MIWVRRGKGFWSSKDGRFDKLKVEVPKETHVNFSTRDKDGFHDYIHVREVVRPGHIHFTVFDWNLGWSRKFKDESDADSWCEKQLKDHPQTLTPGSTPA